MTCTEISCPKTKYPVIGIVPQAVDKKRGADAAKKNYRERLVKSILERCPKFCLHKGDTATNIAQYYDWLKKTLEEHGAQTEFTTWMTVACLLKKKSVHKTGNNTWITALMDSNMEKSSTINVLPVWTV